MKTSTRKRPFLSVVIPVFEEIEVLPELLTRLRVAVEEITPSFEFIFCLDPSEDGSKEFLFAQSHLDSRIKVLEFSRRFGQARASIAGIDFAEGDYVVVMDADLQDPPEVIPDLVKKASEGFEVVIARRKSRPKERPTRAILARIGYAFLERFAEVPIPREAGDFRLLSRRVVLELRRFPENTAFLRGLVSSVGFKTAIVEFNRADRRVGKTKYSPSVGSLKIGIDGIVSSSTALLNLSAMAGGVVAGLALLSALLYLLAKVAGFPFPLGNPTVVISLYLLSGLILVSNGVIGLYIARIYDEVKRRPRYIINNSSGFGSAP